MQRQEERKKESRESEQSATSEKSKTQQLHSFIPCFFGLIPRLPKETLREK